MNVYADYLIYVISTPSPPVNPNKIGIRYETFLLSINAKKCELPSLLDDRAGIEEFISLNEVKGIVVVQGLGFVGAVMSLVCANAITEHYAVIGADLANENIFWKHLGRFPQRVF